LTFTQCGERPERYGESIHFETMSRPWSRACHDSGSARQTSGYFICIIGDCHPWLGR